MIVAATACPRVRRSRCRRHHSRLRRRLSSQPPKSVFVTAPGPAAFFDEGYDQFHSDGTEVLNDIPAPSSGNICLGVFVKTGRLSYDLHHVFWTFDGSGNLIGRGEWDSNITLDKSGASYAGTWTVKNYTLSGVLLLPVYPGTMSAQRITAQ